MKKSTMYIISGILIISLVILLLVTFWEMRSEGTTCLVNPLAYGMKQVEKANGADFTCTCSLSKPNSPILLLNNKGLSNFESGIQTIFEINPNAQGSEYQGNSN